MANRDSETEIVTAFFRWSTAWVIISMSLLVFAATFNGPRTNRGLCAVLGTAHVITEAVSRLPLAYPEQNLASAALQHAAVRAVLAVAAAYGYLGRGPGPSGKDSDDDNGGGGGGGVPVERARRSSPRLARKGGAQGRAEDHRGGHARSVRAREV